MWICLCEAVTSTAIREAILQGATTIGDIAEASAAGTVCGRCKRNIVVLLEEYRQVTEGPDAPMAELDGEAAELEAEANSR